MSEFSLAVINDLGSKVAVIPELQERAKALVVDGDEGAQSALSLRKELTSLEKAIEDARVAAVKPYNDTVKSINAQAKKMAEPLDAAKEEVKRKELAYAAKLEAERQERQRQRSACAQAIQSAKTALEVDAALGSITYEDPELSALATVRKNKLLEEEAAAKVVAAAREGDANATQIAAEKAAALAERNQDAEQKAYDEALAEKARLSAAAPVAPKGVRELVHFEVVDASKVPREFCEVSEVLIRKAHQGQIEAIRAGLFHIPGVKFEIKKDIR